MRLGVTPKNSGMFFFSIYLCVFMVSHFCMCSEKKFRINTETILLPYLYDLPTNYTLAIFEERLTEKMTGCFTWRSSDEKLVKVEALYEKRNCSNKAIVSVVGVDLAVGITRVTAIHKDDENIKLHCNVFTDRISSIELNSPTNEIFIGEPMVKLSVTAKNEDGNVFDSINGVLLQYKKLCAPKTALKFRMIQASNISLHNDVWEKRGVYTSSVLLEALSEGICILNVSTINNENRKIVSEMLSSKDLTLYVASGIQIYPSSEIYILRNATTKIRFGYVNGTEIKVDPEKSSVSETIPGFLIIGNELTTFSGYMVGFMTLNYKIADCKVPDITVDVHIVEPESLEISISEGGFTNLEEMKTYEISVSILAGKKRVLAPEGVKINLKLPSKLFYVISRTENGTHYHVQTLAPGSDIIKAEYIGNLNLTGHLVKNLSVRRASLKVKVCHKLKIFPPHIFLPIHHESEPMHEISLEVSGGTSRYAVGVDDPSIGSIATIHNDNKTTKVVLKINKGGILTVTATDINNINMIATAIISIEKTQDIEVYPSVVEALINNTILLPVALLGFENIDGKSIYRKFDDCSRVLINVEIVEKHVIALDKDEKYVEAYGKGCITLQFRCKYAGHSRINIFFSANKSESSENFKTTTLLSCFKPLKPVHPVRVAVLPLGSTKDIAFEGGPRKWPLRAEKFYARMEASEPELVDIDIIKDPFRYNKDLTVFKSACKSHGETELHFTIGNEPSATLPHPAKAETSIKLVCSTPKSIHLKVHKTTERAKKEEEHVVKVPFYGEKTFSIDLWIKDSLGRKLANISTLDIKWEISDRNLATVVDNYFGFTTHDDAVAGFRKVTRDFKEFEMSGLTGKLKITAKVIGYKKDVLSKLGISVSEIEEISNSIEVKLVSLREMNDLYTKEEACEEEQKECDQTST